MYISSMLPNLNHADSAIFMILLNFTINRIFFMSTDIPYFTLGKPGHLKLFPTTNLEYLFKPSDGECQVISRFSWRSFMLLIFLRL